jgi:ERCC4-type nuclease
MKYTIITDSREQKPLFGPGETLRAKLDVGDYSIKGFEKAFSIERKSPSDAFLTLTSGHKRFKAELNRSQSYDYFAIVVEANLTDIRRKAFIGAQHIKYTKGDTINKILLTLHIKYGIPVFWTNNRGEAKNLIIGLMEAYLRNKKHIL